MSNGRYSRAQAIVHEAMERVPEERDAYLEIQCGADSNLRREVDWLIEAASDTVLDDVPELVARATDRLTRNLRITTATQGHYRLIRRIGEGGMGVVWLAEREVGGACQRVALKCLRAGCLGQHTRFQEEQRILASLNHPNIAYLVDAGIDAEGNPFLAMEHVEGERIDRWCDAHGLDLRARVALFLKVCAAVSYAHERLIIHRDLKPANLLVDSSGEPKLLDFGIARLLDTDAMLATATGVMTPAYASPEQIQAQPLGTASDVWSLGVILYELLTGTRPFAHLASDHARARAILSGAVTPPSRQPTRTTTSQPGATAPTGPVVASRIPADIDAIVLKALRLAPEQRYASVRELADDLRNFLEARPVKARQGRWTYHTQLFVHRNRWPLMAAAVLLAIITVFTWRTLQAEHEAMLQAEVAERAAEFLVSVFSLSDPTQAERHDFSAREVLDRGRDRVDEELVDQPRVRARLLEALGNAYRGINEGSAGAPLLEAAAQLNLDPAVNDPIAAARSLRTKAISLQASQGSTDEAEDAAQRAFDLMSRHADGDALLLADAYGTLALTLNTSGKESEAIHAARKALALREAGGADARAIARSHAELCAVIAGTGEFRKALDYCKQARALHGQAGTTHTNDYRLLLIELSSLLMYCGEYDAAIGVARERLALTRELFGEGSSVLATDRVMLARILGDAGLFEEADALFAKGLPDILRHNGAHSTQYGRALFSAGLLAYERGQFDAAEKLLRQSHAIQAAAVGERDSHLLQVIRVVLCTTLLASGDASDEVRAWLDSVIAIRSQWDIAEGPLAYARLPLAHWHVLRGEHDEAARLLDQVEAVGSHVEPELHARATATRAMILRARGDASGALRLDQSAYEITSRDRGAGHPRTARYALIYARALRAAGEITRAEALERYYRPRLDAAFPPTSAFRDLLRPPTSGAASPR
jgi:serine/threonine-protein kinase